MILKGTAASDGFGLGRAVLVREQSLDYSGVRYSGRDAERARLRSAVEQFDRHTSAMTEHIRKLVGQKESAILTSQIAMLADPMIRAQMEEAIDGGSCAEAAVDSVCGIYTDMVAAVEDELMRQRAVDIRDIRIRLLSILLGRERADLSCLPPGSILVVRELTPSMTVGLGKKAVAGILTAAGGRTSHAAILIRALELPAVLSIDGVLEIIKDGDEVIVDGSGGMAVLCPDEDARGEYLARRRAFLARKTAMGNRQPPGGST